MSFAKVAELAQEFLVKIAEHHYEEHEPKDCKAKDITWVDEETRQEIKNNGTDPTYKPHNPPAAIASEKTWDKAKKAVKKYWKKYDEPWAVVYDVYRKMGGKPRKKKSRKKKSYDLMNILVQKHGQTLSRDPGTLWMERQVPEYEDDYQEDPMEKERERVRWEQTQQLKTRPEEHWVAKELLHTIHRIEKWIADPNWHSFGDTEGEYREQDKAKLAEKVKVLKEMLVKTLKDISVGREPERPDLRDF